MAVSQSEVPEKSSEKIIPPIPGFISGVAVRDETILGVGVADAGNHIMVGEGSALSVDEEDSGVIVKTGDAQATRKESPKKILQIMARCIDGDSLRKDFFKVL